MASDKCARVEVEEGTIEKPVFQGPVHLRKALV
jgi:ribosomal protein L21E